jgi:hypothetical protein
LDRDSLVKAVDQFLEEFQALRGELFQLDGSRGFVSAVTAVAVTAFASELIIRRRRSRSDERVAETEQNEDGFVPFPGLPNSWSWGLAEP